MDKFTHVRFEPSGFTGNTDIPMAKSIVDYVFRWMAKEFLTSEEQPSENGEASADFESTGDSVKGEKGARALQDREREVFVAQADAPPCPECFSLMIRNGACYACVNCGTTSGCS